jgi:CubicO group peptidase (beta-lactamase class C family)
MQMMSLLASAAIGVCLMGCSPASQPEEVSKTPDLSQVAPETLGFDPDRLAKLDAYMQRHVDDEILAGLQITVARRGQIAYFKSVGSAEIDTATPMAADSIFRIYSMSKPITSVAVMMMYEEGKFLLTDPVSKYFPELSKLRVYEEGEGSDMETRPASREMTVQDLLRHTSGLTYGFIGNPVVSKFYRENNVYRRGADPEGVVSGSNDLKEFIANLSTAPLVADPGSAWNYSVSTDVLGGLVEAWSGQSYDVFLEERIFAPLGMVDTGFSVPAEKLDRFTANYVTGDDGGLKEADDRVDTSYADDPGMYSGGGGLVSTSADYLRFSQMLLNKGELDGVRILGPRTVDLMTQDHLPPGVSMGMLGGGRGFGLGFDVVTDLAQAGSLASNGTYSWGGAASTIFTIDPEEEIIMIMMAQYMPARIFPMRPELEALIYQAIVD